MTDADRKKLEEIRKRWNTDRDFSMPEEVDRELMQLSEDFTWALNQVTEQDREIGRLNKQLLAIHREAGKSVHCPPSPIDAFRMLVADNRRLQERVRELRELLIEASNHLDYCGYGDSWERECARESKLDERIEQALQHKEEE